MKLQEEEEEGGEEECQDVSSTHVLAKLLPSSLLMGVTRASSENKKICNSRQHQTAASDSRSAAMAQADNTHFLKSGPQQQQEQRQEQPAFQETNLPPPKQPVTPHLPPPVKQHQPQMHGNNVQKSYNDDSSHARPPSTDTGTRDESILRDAMDPSGWHPPMSIESHNLQRPEITQSGNGGSPSAGEEDPGVVILPGEILSKTSNSHSVPDHIGMVSDRLESLIQALSGGTINRHKTASTLFDIFKQVR
jgi:hypothetical protein